MDLKRLGHVLALAEARHFARAAERVHLSQPAFSRSIQSVERELGMRLFDRDTGDVKPTPAGVFLIERARRLLFDARSLQRDAELYRDSRLGDTAFGAGPFPAATIMPRAVLALRQQYPGVGLRLEMNNWQLLCERLLAEDIEFFVADVRDLPADPRLELRSLGRQAAQLFVRAGHPLAGAPCAFHQVWAHGLATTRMPRGVQGLLARLLGLPDGQVPVLALECDDVALLRQVALASDTVVAVPQAGAAADLHSGALVRLVVDDLPEVFSEMGLVTLSHRTPSPMAQRAIACVQAIAAEVNLASG